MSSNKYFSKELDSIPISKSCLVTAKCLVSLGLIHLTGSQNS